MAKTHRELSNEFNDRRTTLSGSKAERSRLGPLSDAGWSDSRAEDRHALLEVHGFDLMAQIEAMLRHAHQYQREVQRLRGLMGKGQTDTADMPPLVAVNQHLAAMQDAHLSFGDTLAETRQIVKSLEDPSRSDR